MPRGSESQVRPLRSPGDHRSVVAALVAAVIVAACSGPPGSTTGPSESGHVIVVQVTATPTAPPAPASTPSPSPSLIVATSLPTATTGSPLPSASGAVVSLTGRYEAKSDVTSTDKSSSVHTQIHEVADITAYGSADGHLAGVADYTYSKAYQIADEGCKTAWNTGDVSWSEPLGGTWQLNPDGSLSVSLIPASLQGPGISEDYLCLGSVTEHPISVPFAGTLVNGTVSQRHDLTPTGAGTVTGFSWTMLEMESHTGG